MARKRQYRHSPMLKKSQILEVLRLGKTREISLGEIAHLFNKSVSTINRIISGTGTYEYLQEDYPEYFNEDEKPEQEKVEQEPETEEETEPEQEEEATLEDKFEQIMVDAKTVMLSKNEDYATDGDPLFRFKEIAKEMGIEARQVWYVYFGKHLSSIKNYVAKGRLESESLHSRIIDLINYLILLDLLEGNNG